MEILVQLSSIELPYWLLQALRAALCVFVVIMISSIKGERGIFAFLLRLSAVVLLLGIGQGFVTSWLNGYLATKASLGNVAISFGVLLMMASTILLHAYLLRKTNGRTN